MERRKVADSRRAASERANSLAVADIRLPSDKCCSRNLGDNGNYEEYADGHLCFIEPSRPYVRRWLKLVSTLQIVERLASALEKIVHDSGQATDLRWWTDTEVASG
jgi:hypothetical protein